jgi:hypothetical protein
MQETFSSKSLALESDAADVSCPPLNITVAYNIFVWPEQNWRFLVGSQLQDLEATGIDRCAQMLIAISVPEEHEGRTYMELQDLMQQAVRFVRGHRAGRDAIIIQEHENAYEYPAIHSIYRYANSESDEVAHNHLFVYFHTKGMVKHDLLTSRIDRSIFDATFVPWRALAQHFLVYDDVRVATLMPAEPGWGWENFWWVRGKSQCEEVAHPAAYTIV